MEPVTVVWQSDVKCKSASFLDSCKECISNAIDHQSKHTRKKKKERETQIPSKSWSACLVEAIFLPFCQTCASLTNQHNLVNCTKLLNNLRYNSLVREREIKWKHWRLQWRFSVKQRTRHGEDCAVNFRTILNYLCTLFFFPSRKWS